MSEIKEIQKELKRINNEVKKLKTKNREIKQSLDPDRICEHGAVFQRCDDCSRNFHLVRQGYDGWDRNIFSK